MLARATVSRYVNATVEDVPAIIATAFSAAEVAPARRGNRGYNVDSAQRAPDQWRVAPHCRGVNLVRAGRKQPQRIPARAGITARHPFTHELPGLSPPVASQDVRGAVRARGRGHRAVGTRFPPPVSSHVPFY